MIRVIHVTITRNREYYYVHFTMNTDRKTAVNFPIVSYRLSWEEYLLRVHPSRWYKHTYWYTHDGTPPYRDENLHDDRNRWTSQFTITITSFHSLIKTPLTSTQIVNTRNHHGERNLISRRWGVWRSKMEIQRNCGRGWRLHLRHSMQSSSSDQIQSSRQIHDWNWTWSWR